MKKRNFLMMLGLAGVGLTANAQIASLGFEEGDQFYHNPDSSQFASFYADHINLYGGDVWNEKSEDAHSGTYALQAINSEAARGNTWDRGLKLRGLKIEPQKSYRVSFYVKANTNFMWEGASQFTSIKSTLSVGRENLEAPFVSQSGKEYYYNWTDGVMTGDWVRLSFVAYFSGWDVQNQYFDNYDNNIYRVVENDPEDATDNDTIYYKDFYGLDKFSEEFFLTINMYNPGTYNLDDILIEEATMAGCTFFGNTIKVDFGYPTNIAELAEASTEPAEGTMLLPNSCAKVTSGDTELTIATVELKPDGHMYIFTEEDLTDMEDVRVSFTPAEDCPIVYNTDQRPSMDVDADMPVLGFADESIYKDQNITEVSYIYGSPNFVSSVPENRSFELDAATTKVIRLTYDRAVDPMMATISLRQNNVEVADLYNNAVISADDPNTIEVTLPDDIELSGEYQLYVSQIMNFLSGAPCMTDQTLTLSFGPDTDTSVAEMVYDSSTYFAAAEAGTFPKGWLSNDNGTIHQYGLNPDGTVFNYNWGFNPGGGGCRLYKNHTGDAADWIYWRATGGTVGTLTYGEQVRDYVLADGSLDPAMDPDVALYLEPHKYKITFRMAAWKYFPDGAAPKFDFSLVRLHLDDGTGASDETVAQFNGVEARPTVNPDLNNSNGPQVTNITGSTLTTTEFTVAEAGHYMLKFSCQSEGGYHEFYMGGLELMSMPSDAAYYKSLLKAAVDSANTVLTAAANDVYNGTTKTTLAEQVAYASEHHFTSPSEVNAMNDTLYALAGSLTQRIADVDAYGLAITDLQNNVANLAGTKYVVVDDYIKAEQLLAEYGEVSSLDLDDETLHTATTDLTFYKDVVSQLQSRIDDALTYQINKGLQTAYLLGDNIEVQSAVTDAEGALDDSESIKLNLNAAIKHGLYKVLANGGTNDGVIPDEWKTQIKSETELEEGSTDVYKTLIDGLEVTGFVNNPGFYTYATSSTNDTLTKTTPGWEIMMGNAYMRGDQNCLATDTKPVTSSQVNVYRGQYDLCQKIEGLPVGTYGLYMQTRTSPGMNAIDEKSGMPDKFIYATTVEGDTLFAAFGEGSTKWEGPAGCGYTTVVTGIEVDENTVLTIGAKEEYRSGKNINADTQEDKGIWDTNTYVDDVRLFFIAPKAGYDYDAATVGISDVEVAEPVSYEYYTVGGVRLARPQKGINVVKIYRADGTVDVQKVIVK